MATLMLNLSENILIIKLWNILWKGELRIPFSLSFYQSNNSTPMWGVQSLNLSKGEKEPSPNWCNTTQFLHLRLSKIVEDGVET